MTMTSTTTDQLALEQAAAALREILAGVDAGIITASAHDVDHLRITISNLAVLIKG